jgi:hypothetical protein
MRTLIEVLASLAILANAVIYGTDVFGAIVLRPAFAALAMPGWPLRAGTGSAQRPPRSPRSPRSDRFETIVGLGARRARRPRRGLTASRRLSGWEPAALAALAAV